MGYFDPALKAKETDSLGRCTPFAAQRIDRLHTEALEKWKALGYPPGAFMGDYPPDKGHPTTWCGWVPEFDFTDPTTFVLVNGVRQYLPAGAGVLFKASDRPDLTGAYPSTPSLPPPVTEVSSAALVTRELIPSTLTTKTSSTKVGATIGTGPTTPMAPHSVSPSSGPVPVLPVLETTVPAPGSTSAREDVMPSTYSFSPGAPSQDFLGGLLGGIGGFITGGPLGAVAGAITGSGYGRSSTGGGESASSPGVPISGYGGTSLVAPQCPTGFRWNGTQCVAEGITGAIQRIIPGGQTGVMAGGQGATGSLGLGALTPAQVGSTQYGPILRCPGGYVLGRDNLCYHKRVIPNSLRKWPKGTRPLLTAGEMKTLRKIRSLEKKVKRAWQAAGSPGKPRPACKPKTRRR